MRSSTARAARPARVQAANNRDATAARQHSRQASRARSAPPLSVLEGCRLERLSRGRAQRIASSRAKWNDNGLKMLPRGLPNRSKIAPRWLPGGSRAPPESANGSGDLSCSFFWPLGRLSGRSWVALGRSWRSLGAFLASLGGLLALLGPLGRLLGRASSDFSSKGKPGYHGTGSAFSERAASIASG